MKNKLSVSIKKVTGSIFALVILASGFGFVPVVEAVAPHPTVTISSQSASIGNTIDVTVGASAFANTVAGIDFSIQYDPALLVYTGLTQNAISGHGTFTTGTTTNTIIGNWFDSTSLSIDSGAIVTLHFTVISPATTNANLTFSGTPGLSDNIGDPIASATFVGGTVSLNPAKTIDSFSFSSPSATGIINAGSHTIGVTVPFGTDVTALTSTFTTSSGATVTVGATPQVSGTTPNNFSSPVTYTVTASDSTTQTYVVTVTVTPASTIATATSSAFTVNESGSTITGIPYGTASSTLIAGLVKDESHQTWDVTGLTSPVVTGNTLVITAQDGSTVKTYTLVVALNPAKAITAFSFSEGSGNINESNHTVAVNVPYGTSVTALAPTIVLSGGTVSPLTGVAQDFTNPVTYTVTAADSSTQTYTVAVTVLPNTAANIVSFNATSPAATGVISSCGEGGLGNCVVLTVPFGTSLTDLPIAITLSAGATVAPTAGNATFVDGSVVIYTVTAQDGVTTKNYSVTASVAANTAKDITSFDFLGLSGSAVDVITGSDIAVTVPYGTNVAAITPTIGISGASVSPLSGVVNDFTNPVTYTVTAADSSTQTYTVTVSIALNPAKAITAFTIPDQSGSTVINEGAHTIAVTMPYATDVTTLTPTISITGATVNTASGVAQDFTNPVTYTVTAADSSTQTYTVTVTVLPNPDIAFVAADKAALVDSLIQGSNADLAHILTTLTNPLPSTGSVNGSTITWTSNNSAVATTTGEVTRPLFASGDTTVTLTATITKGAITDTKVFLLTVIKLPASTVATITAGTYTVSTGGTASESISGIPFGTSKATVLADLTKGQINQTWNDTGVHDPVVTGDTLVVTAQDGTTQVTYVITVDANPDIAFVAADKAALVDSLIQGSNADLAHILTTLTNPLPSTGSVNGSTITWVSASTTIVSNDGQTVVRPVYANGDAVVTLTATITKGLVTETKTFTLTIIKALNTVKQITAFGFSVGTGAINETSHTILVNVPFGTDVTALSSIISITAGASINAHSAVQDFTNPVTYTITAENGTTQNYVVTVSVLASTQVAPDNTGSVTVSSTTPQVVITNSNVVTTVTVDASTTNPTVDVSSFISNGTGTLPAINITSANANNTTVAIAASTVVTSASTTWNGIIAAPTVTTITLPTESGQTKTLNTAVEVGFAGEKLTFSKAVRLLLPNQAGKRAGYVRTGTAFTEITNVCAADNQITGDALASDSECKINASNGTDLVIWTKHFTTFAAYTQTANAVPVTTSSGGSYFVTVPQVVASTSTSSATNTQVVTVTSVPVDIGCINNAVFSVKTGKKCAVTGKVLGAATFNFLKDLRMSSRGNDVKELQKILIADGLLKSEATGYFGIMTKASLVKWQAKNKLPATGYFGPMTRAFLQKKNQ